ncbi:4946_t:CDS:2 [Funneliformis caledonium]|uniref:4946_t:CDS:1 n=1 Tax=Funneliformis caledonium TaxID=1117310 RepID=A0A9N9CBD0_9GLOM|nr:4946_t:CDS:2 [Funneliformis caledonium]
MTNPLNLAEILVSILNFLLADKALYPILFINRFWYYTVGQILWKHIEFLDSLRQKKFLRICRNLKPFHGINRPVKVLAEMYYKSLIRISR